MTVLADLQTMPGRLLLISVADVLRGEAERIRHAQDALVAAGMQPAWAEGQDIKRALLLAGAGALEWTSVAGAEEPDFAKAQRRKPSQAHRQIADAGRSEVIAEILARTVKAEAETSEEKIEGVAA